MMTMRMKQNLTITAYFIIGLVMNIATANAIELQSYKDTATNTVVISKSAIEKAWASNQPACLKDGAKLLGVNKAYKSKGLGYRDCSNSAAKKRVHKALGIEVAVFKISELPVDMIKEILGKK